MFIYLRICRHTILYQAQVRCLCVCISLSLHFVRGSYVRLWCVCVCRCFFSVRSRKPKQEKEKSIQFTFWISRNCVSCFIFVQDVRGCRPIIYCQIITQMYAWPLSYQRNNTNFSLSSFKFTEKRIENTNTHTIRMCTQTIFTHIQSDDKRHHNKKFIAPNKRLLTCCLRVQCDSNCKIVNWWRKRKCLAKSKIVHKWKRDGREFINRKAHKKIHTRGPLLNCLMS